MPRPPAIPFRIVSKLAVTTAGIELCQCHRVARRSNSGCSGRLTATSFDSFSSSRTIWNLTARPRIDFESAGTLHANRYVVLTTSAMLRSDVRHIAVTILSDDRE